MLNRASQPFVRLVEKYLPDPFVLVLLLTLVTFCAAYMVEGQAPMVILQQWGGGMWGLLTFSMQMLLVLVSGYMLASTPVVKQILEKLAVLGDTPGKAIVLVTLVALSTSWLNWGFGLVAGALFAKALARRTAVDYRLLVASAYSGFVVWHGGLAGSIPLAIATPGHFAEAQIGVIDTGQTLFSTLNLVLLALLFVIVPVVNRLMLPDAKNSVIVSAQSLQDPPVANMTSTRPADKLENSVILSQLIGFAGLIYLGYFFYQGGSLNLNIVNTLFLFLAITLHGTPRRLLHSLQQGMKGGGGILIQFPFYAGIMAVMVQSGLAQTLSTWLISFASADSLAVWSFISAGVVNIFVPSGGGQWAVQAPVMLPAAIELGADVSKVAMAVAWGDAWTNLIQPFWALPVLAIAGLRAKDIMGFCLMQLLVTGLIIGLCLRFL
ncbi:TIGR00366 family protein [Alteromonas sp. C1M14]|uniref:short-chain fatty acid transporter n=1 Tax=Alteromonas sp. C1M14 TaxID=2841567 RepID=UPI001C0982B3|nr:TIGR00366 family protein [Alteromonas sp. C1M14]MBU2978868.1 TIGR00366 family protein [Alteromonas sp. C1M14]